MSLVKNYSTFNLSMPKIIFAQRKTELEEKVQSLSDRIKPPYTPGVRMQRLISFPCFRPETKNVEFPLWYLLKDEDIPDQFRIAHSDDPRLIDPDFIHQFKDWMQNLYMQNYEDLPHDWKFYNDRVCRKVLLLMCNPDLFEKAKEHVIAHEISHVNDKPFPLQSLKYAIASMAILLVLMMLTIVLAASVNPVFLVGLILVFGILAAQGCWKVEHIKKNEKAADLSASMALNDISGPLYYFQNSIAQHKLEKRSRLWEFFDGGFLWPSDSERIAYLKEWDQHQQRKSCSTESA
jgi:hypothetical protein